MGKVILIVISIYNVFNWWYVNFLGRSSTRNKAHTTITYFSCDHSEFMASLQTLAAIAPELESVSFLNYNEIDQDLLRKFFLMSGNLRNVCIKGMNNLVDETIEVLATFNTKLTNITLTHCTSLDFNTVPIIANLLHNTLERVDFSDNSATFLSAFVIDSMFLKLCTKLRHVRIVNNSEFYDVVSAREKYPGVSFQLKRYVGEEDGVIQNE
jgi:hypothetical protein